MSAVCIFIIWFLWKEILRDSCPDAANFPVTHPSLRLYEKNRRRIDAEMKDSDYTNSYFQKKFLRRSRRRRKADSDPNMKLLRRARERITDVQVTMAHVNVTADDCTIYEVYYLTANVDGRHEAKPAILLLHSMADDMDGTAEFWQSVDSLRTFAAAGYRVLAPDLPGTEKSRSRTESNARLSHIQKPQFIKEMMFKMGIMKSIILSVSWSGTFSIPVLINEWEMVSAFIAVSPEGSIDFTEREYKETQVPTLLIYGKQDKEKLYENIRNLPNSKIVIVPGFGSDMIFERTNYFHAICLNFLENALA